MKRDMDLVREILLVTESSGDTSGYGQTITVEGHSDAEVSFHVELMAEAGLLRAESIPFGDDEGEQWMPIRLTWMGYEFLDGVRDPEA